MSLPLQVGTQTQVTAAASATVNSPSATAGNRLVLEVSWVCANTSSALTPAAIAGWTSDRVVAGAVSASVGGCGVSYYSKIAAGGVESPVFASPSGTSDLYANAIILEYASTIAYFAAGNTALSTNNSAASTTGVTVPNTSALATSTSAVLTAVSILSGTGLNPANIAFGGGGWTTDISDQNTQTSVGTLAGHKDVASTAAVGAVYTWTTDATMLAYQAVVVVYSDIGGGSGPAIMGNCIWMTA